MTVQMKSGPMLRYKRRIFGKDWREEYVVLYDNSTLVWLKEKDKQEPEGLLILKDAPELMACGQYTVRVPNRPDLPDGYNVSQLLAFGSRKRQEVHWFLCKSEENALEWMTAISNTLPPPPPAKTATSSEQSQKDATNHDDGTIAAVLSAAIVNTGWGSGWGWDSYSILASSNDVMCFAQNDLGDVDAFGCDDGGDACDFDGCAGFVAF